MRWSQTVVLVKPDAIQRGIIGRIITRFENKGLQLCGLKMIMMSEEMLGQFYQEHRDKKYFDDLIKFMSSAPILAMLWEGIDVVPLVRRMVGATLSREAEFGSIRGDFGMSLNFNLIHASDNDKSAEQEMNIIFRKNEIFAYERNIEDLVYTNLEREIKKA